jgi:hypothetical protein
VPRVALTTFALMQQPYDHPDMAEFEENISVMFDGAEAAPGFIARARPADDLDDVSNFVRDWGVWGTFAVPRGYTGGRTYTTDQRASTLSLWVDLQPAFDYAYGEVHRFALARRHAWMLPWKAASYALWWVGDDEIPTWVDSCERLDHLTDHGPTPHAFDFRNPFDAEGRPIPAIRPQRSEASA